MKFSFDTCFPFHFFFFLNEEMLLKLDEPEIFSVLCYLLMDKYIPETSTLFPDLVNAKLRLEN